MRWRAAARRTPPRSPSAITLVCLSSAAYGILVLSGFASSTLFSPLAATAAWRGFVALLFATSVLMFVTRLATTLWFGFALHAALTWLLVISFEQPPEHAYLLVLLNLAPIVTYEAYGLNLVLAAIFLVPSAPLFCWRWQLDMPRAGALVLTAVGVAFLGALMTRYREATVSLQKYSSRLEENVTSLTRANSLSQDYARSVEEQSREEERLKLARGIHDVVGYTLTNNIMMMEAIRVMAHTEPARIGACVEDLRRNTEDGLRTIRATLASFRAEQLPRESIGGAITKLVRVYQLSTGVQVRYELGNTSWGLFEPHAESVYHFVQEGIINAFRHGRAARVTLLFWDYGAESKVTVGDDGVGCPESPKEGIGIAGMRERARAAGGRLVIDTTPPGFRISLYLPKREREEV